MRTRTITLALVTVVGSSCVRNFDQFVDGGAAQSAIPHYEAPITLCTEPRSTSPARIRFVNASPYDLIPCARVGDQSVSLSGDSTLLSFAPRTALVRPRTLPSSENVTIWFGNDCVDYPSWQTDLETTNLTPGATYALVATGLSLHYDWQLVRESGCTAPNQMMLHVINATGFVADLDFVSGTTRSSLPDVTSAGIDASARPERSYVSFNVSTAASPATWQVSFAPRDSNRAFHAALNVVAGRFATVFVPHSGDGATFDLVICPESESSANGDRAACLDPVLLQ